MPKAVPNGMRDEVFAEATRKPNNPLFPNTAKDIPVDVLFIWGTIRA
jgi:hypothetical protein